MADKKKTTKSKKPQAMDVDRTTIIGSEFAQFATVHATKTEVTFDFVFSHPGNYAEGQVVSRITMPRGQAGELARITENLLTNTSEKS